MDLFSPYLWLIMGILHPILSAVLGKRGEHRNLFTERACCRRQSHFVYVGQDISGSPVSIDVGVCRSHCGVSSRAPNSFETGLPGYSKHSSMLEFLRSKKGRARELGSPEVAERTGHTPSCSGGSDCEPAGTRVERVLLFQGLREVEVIDDCHCEPRLTQCVRVPALKTYFFQTPFESVLDVGRCSGSKGSPEGFACVPTKFDSALLETPNKMDLIQTVTACELKESCYRAPYMEYYYEVIYNSNGIKEEKLKEIDVGRCLGSCTTGKRCILRSSPDSEQCLLWAEGPASSCVPQGYETHMFRSQHGQVRTVLAISSCLCQS